jgi:pimeloyl-ACP methyl ester carboxylesterase
VRTASSDDRSGHESAERFARLADVQLEESSGDGHFVHLVDPDRFATTLRRFIEHCVAGG